ncbi:hypothetical protein KVH31_34875 [Streptomyces olivaceus]|uniref:hypothetical protein n=1 Tax=Streptomyces olivaceus TaxID=47716 RepID=UPI001CC94B31|nr:hypothetical protein [Streptomyces olivaceus]MBZ6211683.1 hypothetical protein [Streptomyces olivaceus]
MQLIIRCFCGGLKALAITRAHGDSRELSANALRLYGACAIRNADLVATLTAAHPEARDELVDWQLITPDSSTVVPAVRDPQHAVVRRMQDVLATAEQQVALLKTLPELASELARHYESVQLRAVNAGSSVYMDDPGVVNARIQDVVGSARREILAAQPGGPRSQDLLDIAVARDSAALDRGVDLRTIYRDTVRDHPVTARYARTMAARTGGRPAQYRTLEGSFERMIIVDREQAFVSNHIVAAAPEHAAWLITDPAAVSVLARTFDSKWERARPWSGDLRARRGDAQDLPGAVGVDGVRTDRRQRAILRVLCSGASQEQAARRFGVSKRKLAEEVAALKALWGVGSLPELIFQYAQSPDCRVNDGAPADQPAGAEYETTA